MNKLLTVDDKETKVIYNSNIINGNTVLVPDYEPYRKKSEQKDKKLRQIKKEQANKRKLVHEKVLSLVLCIFVFGIASIYRYCSVYKAQMQLTEVNSEISSIQKENDDLKLKMIKYNNMQYIEETATSKLHMVRADKNSVIYANLTNNYFQDSKQKKTGLQNYSFFEKILNFIK